MVLALMFSSAARADDPPWIARGANGVVAADSRFASQAGLEILQAGGNAIDAAVATSFALAVARPDSTGLGGGGFLIARFADGRIVVQDFRETAPAAATADMFTKAAQTDTKGPAPSEIGHLAPAVPGLVAGRCQALARWGTMPLTKVIAPAIRLAKEGYPVDTHYVRVTRGVLDLHAKHPALKEKCGYVYETHLPGGKLRPEGDTLKQPALARLLEGIAEHGADFFYKGEVAKAIAKEMQRHGGLITEVDLVKYQVKEREPLRFTYREFELIGMPPPSSGGVALAETLNILEVVNFASIARSDPSLAAHYQIEAMKHAFADRARWLGDPDFGEIPVAFLTSKLRGKKLAARLSPDRVTEVETYGSIAAVEDAGTSHFCVADRWGNVVVSSETVNTEFGSLVAIDEWGLILNNQMDDFAVDPGKPNAFGLLQGPRNLVAAGKRPLSSMTPTIVLKDSKPYLLLGGSGGPRIITSVLNVLLGVTDYELTLDQAMTKLRPHHQWKPETVFFDAGPSASLVESLTARGHKVAEKRRTGNVQAILRTGDGWIGASDPRKGGRPAAH